MHPVQETSLLIPAAKRADILLPGHPVGAAGERPTACGQPLPGCGCDQLPREKFRCGRRSLKTCAAIAGSAPTTCARSATARAPSRWASAREDYAGKPVIAILNTWSDLNPCHAHFRVARRGGEARRVAGGRVPGGDARPLARRDVHEADHDALSQPPGDGGRGAAARATRSTASCCWAAATRRCPALIMGATTATCRRSSCPPGPMLRGNWRGQTLGQRQRRLEVLGRAARRHHRRLRLARGRGRHRPFVRHVHDDGHGVDDGGGRRGARADAAGRVVDSRGRFRTPAHGRRRRGRRIVELVWDDLTPRDVMSHRAAFDNAITAVMALGGSTNAIIHLVAMARPRRRRARPRSLRCALAPDAGARQHPARPGEFLMEDFYYAGGLRGAAGAARATCSTSTALTVNGRTLGENIAGARVYNDDVIRPREQPLRREGGLAVLRGNLAPDGAVIKPTAAEPRLLEHTGPAVVFRDYNDLAARIDDPDAARHRRLGARAAARRAARRAGHARVGHAADPEEAACSRACATWCASRTRA